MSTPFAISAAARTQLPQILAIYNEVIRNTTAVYSDSEVTLADREAWFDAKAAQAAGLLNYVVPAAELNAKVDWLIGRIIGKSPTAIRRGKYAMRAIASMSFDESIAYTESQIALLAMTEDAKEGLKAFAEKRKPIWPGK